MLMMSTELKIDTTDVGAIRRIRSDKNIQISLFFRTCLGIHALRKYSKFKVHIQFVYKRKLPLRISFLLTFM